MADTEKIINAVQIIHEKILAPVIYMCEDEHKSNLFAFAAQKRAEMIFLMRARSFVKYFPFPLKWWIFLNMTLRTVWKL